MSSSKIGCLKIGCPCRYAASRRFTLPSVPAFLDMVGLAVGRRSFSQDKSLTCINLTMDLDLKMSI